jgi:hypothetical protein
VIDSAVVDRAAIVGAAIVSAVAGAESAPNQPSTLLRNGRPAIQPFSALSDRFDAIDPAVRNKLKIWSRPQPSPETALRRPLAGMPEQPISRLRFRDESANLPGLFGRICRENRFTSMNA